MTKQIVTLFLLLTIFGSTSCSNPAPDYRELSLIRTDDVINAPEAQFREPAWLDDTHIAFSYRQSDFGDELGDFRIAYTKVNEEIWQDIDLPSAPPECSAKAGLIKNLQRLPNKALGYTYSCYETGVSGILYLWDNGQDTVDVVHRFPVPFRVGTYSFSPDMTEYLQVGENGLSQELYRVTLGQPTSVERIFSNFERVREPAWSPDGEMIAFVGNERIDQSEGWQDLVLLPWDLYLMDEDGGNVRVLFPQIGNPYNMRWSPDGEWLFFSGSRRPVGADGGIWMLNVETLEIYRIWRENEFFDLSPDGKKIVIIEEEKNEDDTIIRNFAVIYEISEL